MRCPECNQRNSVAATNCYQCGHKFKRKPLPISFKIGAAVAGVSIVVLGAAAAIVPQLTDTSKALSRPAARIAAGPKNGNEARDAKSEFDSAVQNFLKQNGTLAAPELTKKLQLALAGPAFEVHVFDLPRGIRVVEIDVNLQAMDYLVLKNGSNIKVATIPGMEVFDGAKIIAQNAAPNLVLLGHTAGQNAHKPLVKVYSLLPDDADDQSAKCVPPIKADGTAAFIRDGSDINLDCSLFSRGQGERLFAASATLPNGLPDESLRSALTWSNGKYELKPGLGNGQLSILYAVAKILAGAPPAGYASLLGPAGSQLASAGDANPEFTIVPGPSIQPTQSTSRRRRNRQAASSGASISYVLQGKTSAYQADLGRNPAGAWSLVAVKKQEGTAVAAGNSAQPNNTATGVQAQTGQTAVSSVTTTPANSTTSTASTTISPGTTIGAPPGHAKIVEVTSTAQTADVKSQNQNTSQAQNQQAQMPGQNNSQNQNLTQNQTKGSKHQDKLTMVPGVTPPKNGSRPDTAAPSGKSNSNSSFDWTQRDSSQSPAESMTQSSQTPEAPPAESHEGGKSPEQPVGIGATVSDKIDASTVRMRSGPGPNYKQVSTVPRGAKIKVIGKTSGWYKVRVNGQDGYVYGGFLDYSTPDAYNTLTVQKTQRLTDDHNRPIGEAKPGDRMVVLGNTKDGKVRVQLSSGKTAIMNKDVDNIQSDQPQFVP